jgi:hypothetical protein
VPGGPRTAAAASAESYTRTLAPDRREAARTKALAVIPRWYNPWIHLAVPSCVGLGLVTGALSMLRDPGWPELAFGLFMLLASNAVEWRIHKHILHQRSWPLGVLFERHTPEHHVIYLQHDMAMRSTREFCLVLIPSYGILAIFVTTLPLPISLWLLGAPNLAAVYVASTMAYVVSYEWLHLSYHLPPSTWIGRSRLIGVLRRHHARHHVPELMQRWNFNVTVPFCDWVMGTIWRDA